MIHRGRRSDDDSDDATEDAILLALDEGRLVKDKPPVHPLDVPATVCEKAALTLLGLAFLIIAGLCLHAVFTTKVCVHIADAHREVQYRTLEECLDQSDIDGILRGLAQTFTTTLAAHGIEYWLDSGTLLGAVRTQSLNPNDLDLDVGMGVDAFAKLSSTALPFPERYTLQIRNSTMYPTTSRDDALPGRFIDKQSGFYLDIFVFLPSVREEDGVKMLGPVASGCWHECVACGGQPKRFVVPESWIYPLLPCTFEGVRTRCPVNAAAYLTHLYGPGYMKRTWNLEQYLT
ncbi:hypothetical protein ACHHYP_09408 [Achlya hypogyna]|uniref:LicD/FKTN/FKRP nucleotidyltransferase domain-containing protein n=1 Tax=Achlya hypogyna TaxID=1202772 RepID=A0A1V9YN34_ACHHY|nr:hypothetical protein ACHHYP_09408 [Achlya hypogyna]